MRCGVAVSLMAQIGQSEAIHSPEAWPRTVLSRTRPAVSSIRSRLHHGKPGLWPALQQSCRSSAQALEALMSTVRMASPAVKPGLADSISSDPGHSPSHGKSGQVLLISSSNQSPPCFLHVIFAPRKASRSLVYRANCPLWVAGFPVFL
jgi:hypothetical protein